MHPLQPWGPAGPAVQCHAALRICWSSAGVPGTARTVRLQREPKAQDCTHPETTKSGLSHHSQVRLQSPRLTLGSLSVLDIRATPARVPRAAPARGTVPTALGRALPVTLEGCTQLHRMLLHPGHLVSPSSSPGPSCLFPPPLLAPVLFNPTALSVPRHCLSSPPTPLQPWACPPPPKASLSPPQPQRCILQL